MRKSNFASLRSAFMTLIFFGVMLASFGLFAQTSGAAVESGFADGIPVYQIPQDSAGDVIGKWISTAEQYVGIRETKTNSSKEIDQFLRYVGLNPGYAWCMAYAQFTFNQACRSAGVKPTALHKGASVRTVFRQTRLKGKRLPSKFAGERGQMMCFMKPRTAFGHVAIVTQRLSDGKLRTIEGNTGPDGGRDGDGVYRKVRPIRGYPGLRTEGFLRFG